MLSVPLHGCGLAKNILSRSMRSSSTRRDKWRSPMSSPQDRAAHNLILIGDPQQLERPLKGSHPVGAEKSALEHLIGEHKTIPADKGMLLPETCRLHPNICDFTSAMFYEARLRPHAALDQRVIGGHPWIDGAGLWFVPIKHTGCRNSSPQEVESSNKSSQVLQARALSGFGQQPQKGQ